MKGQITTADIYLERPLRNKWIDVAVVKDVVVTIRYDGGLSDPGQVLSRSLRSHFGKAGAGTAKVKNMRIRIKKFEVTDAIDLGETQYDV